jgi:hypothetical protein
MQYAAKAYETGLEHFFGFQAHVGLELDFPSQQSQVLTVPREADARAFELCPTPTQQWEG